MSQSRWIAVASGAAAAISWGSSTVLSKDLLQVIHPLPLLLIQLATSVAFLWGAVLCKSHWRRAARPRLAGVTNYAWLGSLEPALAYLLCLSGLAAATASGATLIQAAESIMIVGVTAVIARRAPSGLFSGLSVMALVALYFALGIDGDAPVGSSAAGIALLVAGTFSAAVYVVLSGKVAHRAPALTITAWQQSVALCLVVAVSLIFGPLGGTPHIAATAAQTHELSLGVRELALCAASGLLQFAVPFSLYMFALQRLPANVAGALLLLTPLAGLLEAHEFLGEELTGRQWLAGGVALAAVAGLSVVGAGHKEVAILAPVET